MKYLVHVFEVADKTPTTTEFSKMQDAHSYLVFQSRKLKWKFFRIAICNKHGIELEIMLGNLSRR